MVGHDEPARPCRAASSTTSGVMSSVTSTQEHLAAAVYQQARIVPASRPEPTARCRCISFVYLLYRRHASALPFYQCHPSLSASSAAVRHTEAEARQLGFLPCGVAFAPSGQLAGEAEAGTLGKVGVLHLAGVLGGHNRIPAARRLHRPVGREGAKPCSHSQRRRSLWRVAGAITRRGPPARRYPRGFLDDLPRCLGRDARQHDGAHLARQTTQKDRRRASAQRGLCIRHIPASVLPLPAGRGAGRPR